MKTRAELLEEREVLLECQEKVLKLLAKCFETEKEKQLAKFAEERKTDDLQKLIRVR